MGEIEVCEYLDGRLRRTCNKGGYEDGGGRLVCVDVRGEVVENVGGPRLRVLRVLIVFFCLLACWLVGWLAWYGGESWMLAEGGFTSPYHHHHHNCKVGMADCFNMR